MAILLTIIMIVILLIIIFYANSNENHNNDELSILHKNENELIEKMWAKIDTQEFVNKILTKNYTLYSIDNWSRKNDSI